MFNIISKIYAQSDQPPGKALQIPKPTNISDPSSIGWEGVINFITSIIDLLLYFAGAVCLLMLFYAALLYALAYGDESKVETAKKTIIWALVGLLIVALAGTIVFIVRNQLNSAA